MKKFISMTLVLMLMLSMLNVGFAGTQGVGGTHDTDKSDLLLNALPKAGKTLSEDPRTEGIRPNDQVRVVIELEDKPVIEHATERGVSFKSLGESTVQSLSSDLFKAQAVVQEEVKRQDIDMTVHRQFANVVNGFSATTTLESAKEIEKLEGVKRVFISNVYERPEPQMSNSPEITNSIQVWQDAGFKGEGMVVAVIDSGIDPSHRDMIISDDVEPALDKAAVDAVIEDKKLTGKYYTEKVPYGYNYMDQNSEIRDLGAGASMHGMHVSGTVGANGDTENGGLKGVAPEAQILGLKVFGNDPDYGSTYGDIIIAAIDDALALGADVMNLSLGASSTWVDREDPEQMAVTRAVENGVLMSISAGNSAHFGSGYIPPLAANPDIGVVGSPGLTAESLQVASVDNNTKLYEHYVKSEDTDMEIIGYGKDDWAKRGLEDDLELIAIGGDKLGEPVCYDGIDVKGKVVLVSRGGFSFYDKTQWAAAEGAAGIIVYNNDEKRTFYKNQGGWDIPFMKIQVKEGDELERLLEAGVIEIEVEKKAESLAPTSGKLSDFTSWGTTPNLDFKPDIAAPGGSIYSTLNNDEYGFMSGTSMAAPHAAGGAALVLQRVEKDFADLDGQDKVEMAKNLMMNTAKPVFDGQAYTSPRRQGAGSMDLKAAVDTQVVVKEKETGLAKVNLREMGDKETFTLVATNYGEADAMYELDMTVQTDRVVDGHHVVESCMIKNADVLFEVNGEEVEDGVLVIPGTASENDNEVEIDVTINLDDATIIVEAPDVDDEDKDDNEEELTEQEWTLDKAFENGYFVEGFVFFAVVDEEKLSAKDEAEAALNEKLEAAKAQKQVIQDATEAVPEAEEAVAPIEQELEPLTKQLNDQTVVVNETGAEIIAANKARDAADAASAAAVAIKADYDEAQEADPVDEELVAALKADYEAALESAKDAEASAVAAEAKVSTEDETKYEKALAELKKTEAAIQEVNARLAAAKLAVTEAEDMLKAAVAELDEINAQIAELQSAFETALEAYHKPVSVPYMGFHGDWGAVPIFDANWYEADERTSHYDYTGLIYPNETIAGVDVDEDGEDFYNLDAIAFSPDDDNHQDSIYPVFSLLRNAVDVEINILDENKEEVRTIAILGSMRKHFYDGGYAAWHVSGEDWAWDGKINGTVAEDGQYYYQIKARIDSDEEYQKLIFPVDLDTTEPVLSLDKYDKTTQTLTVKATEEGSGIEVYTLSEPTYGTDGEITDLEVLMISKDGTFDLTELQNRPHKVLIDAVDHADHVTKESVEVIIKDGNVPEIVMTPESYDVLDKQTVKVAGTIAEMTAPTLSMREADGDYEEVEVTADGVNTYKFEKEFAFKTDGKKVIDVKATDKDGNVIEFARKFFVDTAAPVIEMTTEPTTTEAHGIVVVADTVETVDFKGTISDNFPVLHVELNGSVLYEEELDYVGYEDQLKAIEWTMDEAYKLSPGMNDIQLLVVDAAGTETTKEYKVYRKKSAEDDTDFSAVAPVIETLTVEGEDVSVSRPLTFTANADKKVDWKVELLYPDGKVAETFTAENTATITGEWTPERTMKLNGEYTVKAVSTIGELSTTETETFTVYNYETRVKNVETFEQNGMLNISAELLNLETTAQNPMMVVVVRYSDDAMMSISTVQTQIAAGGSVTLSTGTQIPEAGTYTVEVFAWDGWEAPALMSGTEKKTVEIE